MSASASMSGSASAAATEAQGGAPAPEGIALAVDDDLVKEVDFSKEGGLVPAIVQDATD